MPLGGDTFGDEAEYKWLYLLGRFRFYYYYYYYFYNVNGWVCFTYICFCLLLLHAFYL